MKTRTGHRIRLSNVWIKHSTMTHNPCTFTYLEFLASRQVGQLTDCPKRNAPRSRVARHDTLSGQDRVKRKLEAEVCISSLEPQ
jgi:hypothetical protein